uniref:Uncharacterized protein n=1 Tax=Anguilla anguilla TaxID=7936 RepID=A0A0E9RGQ2_ANGAN
MLYSIALHIIRLITAVSSHPYSFGS